MSNLLNTIWGVFFFLTDQSIKTFFLLTGALVEMIATLTNQVTI